VQEHETGHRKLEVRRKAMTLTTLNLDLINARNARLLRDVRAERMRPNRGSRARRLAKLFEARRRIGERV
jgi:hypothetical protein